MKDRGEISWSPQQKDLHIWQVRINDETCMKYQALTTGILRHQEQYLVVVFAWCFWYEIMDVAREREIPLSAYSILQNQSMIS